MYNIVKIWWIIINSINMQRLIRPTINIRFSLTWLLPHILHSFKRAICYIPLPFIISAMICISLAYIKQPWWHWIKLECINQVWVLKAWLVFIQNTHAIDFLTKMMRFNLIVAPDLFILIKDQLIIRWRFVIRCSLWYFNIHF